VKKNEIVYDTETADAIRTILKAKVLINMEDLQRLKAIHPDWRLIHEREEAASASAKPAAKSESKNDPDGAIGKGGSEVSTKSPAVWTPDPKGGGGLSKDSSKTPKPKADKKKQVPEERTEVGEGVMTRIRGNPSIDLLLRVQIQKCSQRPLCVNKAIELDWNHFSCLNCPRFQKF
jgi:hypothetical protein